MLDNILDTVRRGAEKVQRRGEEVAQVARLRMEVFQLGRELDGTYGRLGRAYHGGAQPDQMAELQTEIRRLEAEIQARERLITELGSVPDEPGTQRVEPAYPVATPTATAASTTAYNTPAAVPHPGQEVPSMTKNDVPTTPDPTMQHSDERLVPGDKTASQGNEAARDEMVRHRETIEEGKASSKNPDPLDL
ncbi:hypothetical protein [Deinococcus sp. Leaf326]|uniref:hypothetical protein n=1 Tax=Deinococcus sp. Leaf326 TaxID=1736338 RepID=UPI0006FEAABA|nr:hypothetical protein [Deinococcus sp. Leaf326]KQR36196.1 hypothetical protein ASF71_15155 [Deinococcus sp. Leaf326]